jgi:hypothetical protein
MSMAATPMAAAGPNLVRQNSPQLVQRRIDTIRIPRRPLTSFDMIVVDSTRGICAFSDRLNRSIDLLDILGSLLAVRREEGCG